MNVKLNENTAKELKRIGNEDASIYGGSCIGYNVIKSKKVVIFDCIEHGEDFAMEKTFVELKEDFGLDIEKEIASINNNKMEYLVFRFENDTNKEVRVIAKSMEVAKIIAQAYAIKQDWDYTYFKNWYPSSKSWEEMNCVILDKNS